MARVVRLVLPAYVFSLFLFSGFACLVYQFSWGKIAAQEIGMDGVTTAAVIAAFLLAMSAGSYFAQHYRKSGLQPLLLFILLEAGLALFAFFSEPLIRAIFQALGRLPLKPFSAASYALDFCVLIVLFALPACALGAALPLFAAATSSGRDYRKKTTFLYGLAALGGTAGVFFAGLFSIGTFGIHRTLMGVAAVQAAYALVALALGYSGVVNGIRFKERSEGGSKPREKWKERRSTLALAFLLGFIAIAYQILYFRVASYFFSCTSYVSPITLFSYLTLLTLGYFYSGRLSSEVVLQNWGGWVMLSGASLFLAPYVFYFLNIPFHHAKIYAGLGWSAVFRTVGLSLALFVPVFFLAGLAPALFALRTERLASPIDFFGGFASAQGLGGFVGALATALLLLPLLGTVGSFRLILFLLFLVSILMSPQRNFEQTAKLAATFLVSFWVASPTFLARFADSAWNPPISVSEDLLGTVFIYEEGAKGERVATLGSENITDIPQQDFSREIFPLDLVQALRKGQPLKNVLVIGMGRGDQALILKSVYPAAKVHVIELLPSVVKELQSSKSSLAQLVLRQLVIDWGDGRRFLNRAESTLSEKYDLVQIGVLNASAQGAGSLYTREAFKTASSLLSDSGVVVFRGYPPAVRAAQEAFPFVSGASGGKTGTAHGIGAKFPFPECPSIAQDYKAAQSFFAEKLSAVGVGREFSSESTYYPPESLRQNGFEKILPQTDDLPVTEYFLSQVTSLGEKDSSSAASPLHWGRRAGGFLLEGHFSE